MFIVGRRTSSEEVCVRKHGLAWLAVVVVVAFGCGGGSTRCSAPSALFRHELGHAIGIFGHPSGGLMASPMIGSTATQRDINLLVQLYRLPHGTTIGPDGTWRVVQ
jgi:hypothetical protein